MATPFKDGPIEGVIVDRLKSFHDQRGWLLEMFRNDDLGAEHVPLMGYVSETLPGVSRGPHEHVDQTDVFIFIGPGVFRVQLWDSRPKSPTYHNAMTLTCGADEPTRLIVPPGVIHGYKCISTVPALAYNFPNRLYKGPGRKEPVDEIRHEAEGRARFKWSSDANMNEPLTIRCRENGPLVLKGNVTIVDHLGGEFPIPQEKDSIALCRCGASRNKPFCDGQHKQIGFQGNELAPAMPAPNS